MGDELKNKNRAVGSSSITQMSAQRLIAGRFQRHHAGAWRGPPSSRWPAKARRQAPQPLPPLRLLWPQRCSCVLSGARHAFDVRPHRHR